jgi:hypothetical protein
MPMPMWPKRKHPKFSESIKAGKEYADANVASRLYERAMGYSHPEVHVSNYQGEITLTPLVKHYPPDTNAASLWLRNRQPQKWRDKTGRFRVVWIYKRWYTVRTS